jgi:hypothetical protein
VAGGAAAPRRILEDRQAPRLEGGELAGPPDEGAYSAFASDLSAGDVASFTLTTPNLCHDMHGAAGCPSTNEVTQGDAWLSTELPRILAYAHANAGAVFILRDEGDSTLKMPSIAAGPGVKTG